MLGVAAYGVYNYAFYLFGAALSGSFHCTPQAFYLVSRPWAPASRDWMPAWLPADSVRGRRSG